MKRKIYQKMMEWKHSSCGRTALMLDGARRVGKSYIAEEFAKNEYDSYLVIDFARVSKDVRKYFNDYLEDLDTFFEYLQAEYNIRLTPRRSLVIFDEVQRFPRAREAIKYLVADGRFDYIETGSLISIRKNVKDIVIPSEERHIEMFPLDFEEFLWAMGCDVMIDIMKNAYAKRSELPDGMHRRIMDMLRKYMVVGGMPQAVAEYAESKDMARVEQIKRDILSLYRSDIMKFGGSSKHKILSVSNAIPGVLSRHEWRFRPGDAKKGTGIRSYDAVFEWLKSSMIVNVAYNATEPNIGLELSSDHSALKCYMGDTGLFVSMAFSEREMAGGDVGYRLITGKLEVNAGLIYENLVAQMLRSSGHGLYFYSTSSQRDRTDRMEVDFLIAKSQLQRRHNISPIEVKSAGQYMTRSLEKFTVKFAPFLADAYILHPKNVVVENVATENCATSVRRVFLPLYMAALLD